MEMNCTKSNEKMTQPNLETNVNCITYTDHSYSRQFSKGYHPVSSDAFQSTEKGDLNEGREDKDEFVPPLLIASENGHLEVVQYLSNESNVDERSTPLHLASLEGQLDVVKDFIKEANADTNLKNKKGGSEREKSSLKIETSRLFSIEKDPPRRSSRQSSRKRKIISNETEPTTRGRKETKRDLINVEYNWKRSIEKKYLEDEIQTQTSLKQNEQLTNEVRNKSALLTKETAAFTKESNKIGFEKHVKLNEEPLKNTTGKLTYKEASELMDEASQSPIKKFNDVDWSPNPGDIFIFAGEDYAKTKVKDKDGYKWKNNSQKKDPSGCTDIVKMYYTIQIATAHGLSRKNIYFSPSKKVYLIHYIGDEEFVGKTSSKSTKIYSNKISKNPDYKPRSKQINVDDFLNLESDHDPNLDETNLPEEILWDDNIKSEKAEPIYITEDTNLTLEKSDILKIMTRAPIQRHRLQDGKKRIINPKLGELFIFDTKVFQDPLQSNLLDDGYKWKFKKSWKEKKFKTPYIKRKYFLREGSKEITNFKRYIFFNPKTEVMIVHYVGSDAKDLQTLSQNSSESSSTEHKTTGEEEITITTDAYDLQTLSQNSSESSSTEHKTTGEEGITTEICDIWVGDLEETSNLDELEELEASRTEKAKESPENFNRSQNTDARSNPSENEQTCIAINVLGLIGLITMCCRKAVEADESPLLYCIGCRSFFHAICVKEIACKVIGWTCTFCKIKTPGVQCGYFMDTSAIDSLLTALTIKSLNDQNFLARIRIDCTSDAPDGRKSLLQSVIHCISGDFVKAHETWFNFLSVAQKLNLPTGDSSSIQQISAAFNTTETDMVYKFIQQGGTFILLSVCDNDNCSNARVEKQFSELPLLPNVELKTFFNSEKCEVCGEQLTKRISMPKGQKSWYILARNLKNIFTPQQLMMMQKKVFVDQTMFKLNMITLYNEKRNHFSSLHLVKDTWLFYDNQIKSNTRLRYCTPEDLNNTAMHVLYLPETM